MVENDVVAETKPTPKKRVRRTKKEIEEQRRKDAEELQRKIDAGENVEVVKKKKGKGKGRGVAKKEVEEEKEITCDDIRREKVEYLMRQFSELSEIQVKDLEIGIYNYVIDYITKKGQYPSWNDLFIGLYKHKLMSVVNNMKKYDKLIEYIKDGVYKPHDIPFLEYKQIAPELWEYLDEKKKKEEENLSDRKMVPNSSLYTCKKCHKKDFYVVQIQQSSGDEGYHNHCWCCTPGCGFFFKFRN